MHTTSTLVPARNRQVRRFLSCGALALVTGLAVTACASEASVDAKDKDKTTTTLADSTTVAPAGTDDASSTDGSSTGGSSTGGSTTGGGTTGGQPTSPAPVITSFTTPDSIDCHNGSFQQFTASWATTNATKVTISIDGPGVYDTYGANGEADLPFNCSSSHTFLLTAHGADGQTVSKSITLQPRNAQSSAAEDE